jgi:hypothetical protein
MVLSAGGADDLVEQIAHLRQLAIADPDTSLLELTLINALAELADAVQELSAGSPPRNSAGSRSPGGSSPGTLPWYYGRGHLMEGGAEHAQRPR